VTRRRLEQSTISVLAPGGKRFNIIPSLCSLPTLVMYVTEVPINVICNQHSSSCVHASGDVMVEHQTLMWTCNAHVRCWGFDSQSVCSC